jgi:hypothetical protein
MVLGQVRGMLAGERIAQLCCDAERTPLAGGIGLRGRPHRLTNTWSESSRPYSPCR